MALRYGSKNASAFRYNSFVASALRYGSKLGWSADGDGATEITVTEKFTSASTTAFTLGEGNYSKFCKAVGNHPYDNELYLLSKVTTAFAMEGSSTTSETSEFHYNYHDGYTEVATDGDGTCMAFIITDADKFNSAKGVTAENGVYCVNVGEPFITMYTFVYIKASTDYLTFTEQEDGTYSVVAKDSTNMPDEVYLPLTYNGKGVTALGDKAFNNCYNITKIVLPNTITSIGSTAFQNCEALTEVNIPSGVTEIGDYTFFNCTALSGITIPDTVTSIGELAFAHCTFAEIVIPATVTTIGADAFFNCANLTIKCKATEKPSGWDDNWNSSDRPVTWGYTG